MYWSAGTRCRCGEVAAAERAKVGGMDRGEI